MSGHARTTFYLIPLGGAPDIPVGPAPVMLGRDPSCEVRLDSPKVSRHHCCLEESCGLVLVRDLGSTNGTRVNGRGVRLGWLEHGDVLSVAHLRFRLLRLPGADAVRRIRRDSWGLISEDGDNTYPAGRQE